MTRKGNPAVEPRAAATVSDQVVNPRSAARAAHRHAAYESGPPALGPRATLACEACASPIEVVANRRARRANNQVTEFRCTFMPRSQAGSVMGLVSAIGRGNTEQMRTHCTSRRPECKPINRGWRAFVAIDMRYRASTPFCMKHLSATLREIVGYLVITPLRTWICPS